MYNGQQQVAIFVGNQWQWVSVPFSSAPSNHGDEAAELEPAGHWADTPWGRAFLPDRPGERVLGGQRQVAIFVSDQWQWVPAPFSSTPIGN
jgi:hypothetical protein